MAKARVTFADLAKPVGVSPEMIRRYAGGYAMPRKEAMAKLAKLLGVTEAELQYGSGSDPRRADQERRLEPDEITLLETYRQLGPTEKKIVRARAVELLEAFGPPNKKNPFGKGTQ